MIFNFSSSRCCQVRSCTYYLPFPFTCTRFVKGDLYPEIRAQRNAEDDGFFVGPAQPVSLALVTVLRSSTYSLGVRDKNESKINK